MLDYSLSTSYIAAGVAARTASSYVAFGRQT